MSDSLEFQPAPAHRVARPDAVQFSARFTGGDLETRCNYWTRVASQSGYNQREMARRCGISLRHLERCIKRDLARTPEKWLNQLRMLDATLLLAETPVVKVVAFQLGYKQVSHFCRKFKDAHGITPTNFIRQNLQSKIGVAQG